MVWKQSYIWIWPLAALLPLLGVAVFFSDTEQRQKASHGSVVTLLNTEETVIGQPITYPTQGKPKVTSVIVTMQPGEETGWHRHDVPMFGYILEGEVTVDYGAKGTRVYRQGDAVMEAVDWPHSGRNTGGIPARILAVFMGAAGVSNTEMLPAHAASPH